MADIHVLEGDRRGRVSVVMHIPVPPGTNSVDINWRDAIVGSGIGGTTQFADAVDDENPKGWEITVAEKDQIVAGELHEHRTSFPLESAGTTPVQHQVALRAFYVQEKAAVIADLQRRLKYTGHTESES